VTDVGITLLGGFAVTVGGMPVDPTEWRRRQAAALVKILALSPRRTLHREQLIDLLWPELTVEDAAPRLHKAAHYARRALDASTVQRYGLTKRLAAVRGCRGIGKRDMKLNDALPSMSVDPETYTVTADGEVLSAEPARVLPLAQRYWLF